MMPQPAMPQGTSVQQETDVYDQFREMCFDLNMDKLSELEAWKSYCQVKQNYTLEGCKLHWLACALYVACRRGSVPAVGDHASMQGNFISLTRLLRFSNFSLLEFFDKSKKWAEMSNLPHPFQRNLDALERNFAVSTFLFNKYYEPMFKSIFIDPIGDPPRPPKSRKQRRAPCTSGELFQFTWTLFVLVKSMIPSVSSDLVSTYHLLLACIDFICGVALTADRRDLFNHTCPALPENIHARDYQPPEEVPSVLEYLCEQFDGLIVEAKSIRQHIWREKMQQLFTSDTIYGQADTLDGILNMDLFEVNRKSINKRYEEYLLTCGNFDERTFLGQHSSVEIGTPSKANNFLVTAGDLAERLHVRRSIMVNQAGAQKSVLVPQTPLTGRGYLRADAAPAHPAATPITASMYSVSRLQALLEGRRPAPSPQLVAVLSGCAPDPTDQIAALVSRFESEFSAGCAAAMAPHEAEDLVQRRFHMAASFYYKTLESIVMSERRRKPDVNLLTLLEQSVFHRCLLACSLEIVLFSYSTAPLEFPWLLDTLHLQPYDFYKLLEIIIREEQGLCRDVVKHLNKVEEQVLDSMAWRRCSRLWAVIEAAGGLIPSSETVAPHLQDGVQERQTPVSSAPSGGGGGLGLPGTPGSQLISPGHHNPLVRRLFVAYSSRPSPHNPHQSPVSSAAERFMSPVVPSTARRRLFVSSAQRDISSQARSASPVLERHGQRPESAAAGARTFSIVAPTSGDAAAPATAAPPAPQQTPATAAPPAPQQTPATAAPPAQQQTPVATSADAEVASESETAPAENGSPAQVQSSSEETTAAPPADEAEPKRPDTEESSDLAAAAGADGAETAGSGAEESNDPPPEGAAVAQSRPTAAVPETPDTKPKQNSLGLFFRKFYYLASVRMRDLCTRLQLTDDVREIIWTVFEFVIVHHVTMMQGRHLDQLIMSSIFVVCKALGISKKFTDIMGMYRCQPQARSHVYRSVLLGINSKQQLSGGGAEREDRAGGEADEKGGGGGLQTPVKLPAAAHQPSVKATPAACPPTPSRMAGTATNYEFEDRNEERGDIIQFYNQVFVEKVKGFVNRFNWSNNKPPVSPLPSPRHSPLPVSRKVSARHAIYISPLKQSPSRFHERAANVRSYSFNRSPAHELRSINTMVKTFSALGGGERAPAERPHVVRLHVGVAEPRAKRPLPLHETGDLSPDTEPKRYKARLRDVLDQRQANVGE